MSTIRHIFSNSSDQLRSYAVSFAEAVVARLAPPTMGEFGALDDASGDVLSPRDEVLAAHGQGDLGLYEKLRTDDQVFATMRQRRTEVISREWKVDPGGEGPLDEEAADDLRQQLGHIGWDQVTYRMLGGILTGNSYGECMYQMRGDGHVLLDQIKVRASRRFVYNKTGDLLLKRKSERVPVPPNKFWTFRSGSEDDDDPYGLALGQMLYWPVWFKKNGWKFWAVFLERFANPTPKATIPPGTKPEERAELIKMLGRIMNGGRIVVPRGVDVELIQAIRSSGGDFQVFCELMDRAIAKIVLMQTMTTEAGSSYSQAQVHYKVMSAGAKSDSDLIDESFRRGPAAWLTEWNYPGAAVPVIYRDFTLPDDLQAVATRDQTLSNMGWRPKAEYIAATYGDNYEYSPPVAPAGPPALNFAEPLPRDPAADLVGGDSWRRVMGPERERIDNLLSECDSLEDFRLRLGELALDNPHAMADALARAMFAGRVAGNVEAEDDEEDDL